MWLKNYYKVIAYAAFCRGTEPRLVRLDGNTTAPIAGETVAPGYNHNANSGNTGSVAVMPCHIVFGTGTAAVAYNDHALENKWTQDISRIRTTSTAPELEEATGILSSDLTATVQNTGETPVTVTEWGIEGGRSGNEVMLYRDLLTTPVTLNQFEAMTFSCTLLYQIPNWSPDT